MRQFEHSSQKPLPRDFYDGSTQEIARNLLGKSLVVKKPEGATLAVLITEVEAYLSKNDPASHSHIGPTKRNQSMFEGAGTCYVYLSYGMHYCVNVVTQKKGVGEAILIRGALPLFGLATMVRNRRCTSPKQLLNGPGKLTQALGINMSFNGITFDSQRLQLADIGVKPMCICKGHRIGISKAKEKQLRFFTEFSNSDGSWIGVQHGS